MPLYYILGYPKNKNLKFFVGSCGNAINPSKQKVADVETVISDHPLNYKFREKQISSLFNALYNFVVASGAALSLK